MSFKPVDPKVNFAAQEEELLKFWDKQQIFKKSLELRRNAKRYVFFEGPPTANAKPGLHSVLARYFKDLFPRYKTMRGFLVERKAGWDTHGLPVEIAVEKELKLASKPEIEKYGVAKFNAKAKESVWAYKEEWEKFTRRIGFWLDMEHPYITYNPGYVESVWAILKAVWDRGLIYQGYRVVPRCTRCGTALSSHEVAQGYREIEENSIFVKFKVKDKPNTYILSWTTTPWTLPGNVALAVGEKIEYAKVSIKHGPNKGQTYILALNKVNDVIDVLVGTKILAGSEFDDADVHIDTVPGKDLIRLEYEPLFPGAVPSDTPNFENAFKVYPADFVTTDEGTGVVHTAVMYGVEDYDLGEKIGLPKFHTVMEDGTFGPTVKQWAGKYVKDKSVEEGIVADLKKCGLLLKEMPYKHDYPFCWRCETPLLYYAANSWFIAMSKLRDDLLKSNQTINWVPEYLKGGRFGEWLREVNDWGISRERYWGTPLPFWMSDDGEKLCIGSFDELRRLAKDKDKIGKGFDPHKPFVDEIVLEKDGKGYKRVAEVLDVWFDSGAMPFAQWHYPFENKDRIDKGLSYPADFISEAVDQTRGWFYTLLAIATLMGKEAPYKNVVCLGLVLDKHGKKMSKSKGNVVDPWMIFGTYGSDALRWYLFTINQPGLPKNFDEGGVKQVIRRFMLTLWNTYSFFVTYANIDDFQPEVKVSPKNVLDKWIWARRNQLVEIVTQHLDKYEPMQACMQIESFIDDLSNWYVRRSRRRFWKGEMDADKRQGYIVFYNVLTDLAKLLAPFMPFVSETIYTNLKGAKDLESVHLTDWPKPGRTDAKILDEMKKVREIVEVGLNQREQAGIKVRQPLSSMSVATDKLDKGLQAILRDEINVKEVKLNAKENRLDIHLNDELQTEGVARELVRAIQVLRKEKGFEIEDRIRVKWMSSNKDITNAISKYADYIRAEVLATVLEEGENQGEQAEIDGSVVKLWLEK